MSRLAAENGAIAATPAVLDAVADALGVAHADLPLTPERVWRLTREAST
jgi:aerobic carbon-monoxide dehydrogenase large subunit